MVIMNDMNRHDTYRGILEFGEKNTKNIDFFTLTHPPTEKNVVLLLENIDNCR